MAFTGGQYLVTASAVNIATALAITNPGIIEAKQIVISYNPAAVNPAFLGGPLVTNVPANAAFTFPVVAANIPSEIFQLGTMDGTKSFWLTDFFLVGTANAANLFFISIGF